MASTSKQAALPVDYDIIDHRQSAGHVTPRALDKNSAWVRGSEDIFQDDDQRVRKS